MRLTSEVILGSENYLNAYNDREINFRGKKIPAIENLAILQDAYDVIDFSDNDIKKIDNFPTMNRLNTLLFHNNNISRIHPQIGKYLPNLKNMILNNNKIQHYYEIEHLSSFQQLTILSLLENPITYRQYYREYTIYKLNSLKVLDFQKISNKERKSIQSFFETNQSGKQFLIQVENEKNFYYQQLQQKSQQISSVLSSSAAAAVSNNGNHSNGTSNVPPLPTPPPPASKPGQLVLTEDQKLQVKQAIERATTKEEIDLIEHQLKTGTFVFKATASQLENSDSNSQRDDGKSGTKAPSKALSSQDYADMDVID